jgi:hypothetical protein
VNAQSERHIDVSDVEAGGLGNSVIGEQAVASLTAGFFDTSEKAS